MVASSHVGYLNQDIKCMHNGSIELCHSCIQMGSFLSFHKRCLYICVSAILFLFLSLCVRVFLLITTKLLHEIFTEKYYTVLL